MGLKNCLILAAGKNTRLDNGIPKSMLEIGGETLLERHIRLFSGIGVENFCIVTGYRNEMLEEFIAARLPSGIEVIHNPRFDLANGVSLNCAAKWVNELDHKDFYFTMADHFFSVEFIDSIATKSNMNRPLSLVVDVPGSSNSHIDYDDVTKVLGSKGLIETIGKNLNKHNFYDTGLFLSTEAIFKVLNDCIESGRDSISHMVQHFAEQGEAGIIENSGFFWNDVDTQKDLSFMRSR